MKPKFFDPARSAFIMASCGIERDVRLSELADAEIDMLVEAVVNSLERVEGMRAMVIAYRMGGEARQRLIASWLRLASTWRDDRADNDGASILTEAAELIETGEFREAL